jgi:hypothetical protein
MSFPFFSARRALRQRILLVLSSGGVLGIPGAGCGGEEVTLPSCERAGPIERECRSRADMEARARQRCAPPGILASCTPRPEADVPAQFDSNACLLPTLVTDGCCNAADTQGAPQPDGSCCYYHCPASVCC